MISSKVVRLTRKHMLVCKKVRIMSTNPSQEEAEAEGRETRALSCAHRSGLADPYRRPGEQLLRHDLVLRRIASGSGRFPWTKASGSTMSTRPVLFEFILQYFAHPLRIQTWQGDVLPSRLISFAFS